MEFLARCFVNYKEQGELKKKEQERHMRIQALIEQQQKAGQRIIERRTVENYIKKEREKRWEKEQKEQMRRIVQDYELSNEKFQLKKETTKKLQERELQDRMYH